MKIKLKTKIVHIFVLISLCLPAISISGTKEYVVGSGSEFRFIGQKGENISLNIYISESSFAKLGVEYFFSDKSKLLPLEVWQQYTMGIKESGLSLDAGYIQSNSMAKPEIMTADFLKNNPDGVELSDFFFSKNTQIDQYKIGLEKIEVPAGSIFTTHYRKKNNNQTVDFWISDAAGAIGLVKLISTGSTNQNQNYSVELMSLLKNVKPKINPKEALPLSEKGRMFLSDKNK